MTQPSMASSAEATADTLRWPEQLRSAAPPRDRFPWLMIMLWLLPGLLVAAALVAAWVYLEQSASKQIIYLTGDRHLGLVRADGADAHTFTLRTFENSTFQGLPVWSPNGSAWAIQPSANKVLIVQSIPVTPTAITMDDAARVAMLGQPWSADGAYIALLALKDNKTSLRIADVQQHTATVNVQPDPRWPLNWNPTRNELLTTVMSGTSPLALRAVTPDGQVRAFEPDDKQTARMFGVWSPDGTRVAYIASPKATAPGGSIWIANSDGANPKQVVADGLNSAPVWSPSGDALFFTRILTDNQTMSYDLYRVRPDEQSVLRVGGSVSPDLVVQQGQPALIAWSPDGLAMYFQADERGQRSIYVAAADGSNAQLLTSLTAASQPVTAHWSPTNRAVLVSSSEHTQLYWSDRKSPTIFPTSIGPAWQP